MKDEKHMIVPCDLCGSTETVEVPHCREYTDNQPIQICKKCGLVYANQRRTYKEVADSWSKDLFGDKLSLDSSQLTYTAHNPWVIGRLTFVTEFIDSKLKLKGKNVCDIGAGEGTFLQMAREKGANVFGIEPSEKNCALLKSENIDCFLGPIEEYEKKPKKGYKADIATMMWTLECCQNPRKMLQVAHDILKEKGCVVWAGGSRILVPFKKPLHMYFSKSPQDTHPLHPSFNAMKGLMAVNGFEVKYHNHFIDNDIMIVIGQKKNQDEKIEWESDDYKEVADFFERWHKESLNYK